VQYCVSNEFVACLCEATGCKTDTKKMKKKTDDDDEYRRGN